MTDSRFDELTKGLGERASRRAVVKTLGALALGGLLSRTRGDSAAAQARQTCARLHQDCSSSACCPHLACENGACCRPTNETCYQDSDCCTGNICRSNPSGLGGRCLPPAGVGEACVVDTDCATGYCDPYSLTCTDFCTPDGFYCAAGTDCCSAACDITASQCVVCLPSGANCGPYPYDCINFSCCSGDYSYCYNNGVTTDCYCA
jgi:hypothetical protein